MNRLRFVLVALSAMSSAIAFADVPPMPTVKFVGCVNGNMCVTLEKTVVPTNVVFQIKSLDKPGSDWKTLNFVYVTSSLWLNNTYSYYAPYDFPGATLIRVAETNDLNVSEGERKWREVGPVTNTLHYATTEKIPTEPGYGGANGYSGSFRDGMINTMREANGGAPGCYQRTTNLWLGVVCNSPVGVSMIRYVPRQDDTGLLRLKNVRFQCADDAAFLTNVVTLGVVDSSALSLGRVFECPVDPPVTSRYFRAMRPVASTGEYIAIDEIELVPDSLPEKISISANDSGDWTNHWPAIAWSVPAADLCNTGIVQRSLSAAGPFADVSGWTDATTGETFVDSNIVVGVTYYYRVKAHCVSGGPLRGKMFYSDVVSFVRGRRLERSWDDLTKFNDGVSVMEAFKWVDGRTGYTAPPKRSFDGSTSTYTETTCYTNAQGETQTDKNRVFNAVVGVNLGAKYHVCGSLVYPRDSTATTILERTRVMSICGADDEYLTNVSVLSTKLGGFTTACWQYNSTTNSADQFQYVFLWSPTHAWTYGDVAEIGFFGYSDQDIVDSGLLIPPTTVSCVTNSEGVVVSWDRGWNNASYRVERSRAGSEAWVPVASLETNVFSYLDESVPRKGTWQWRVTSVAEGGETISSLPCSRYYNPQIGMAIIVF